MLQGYSFLILPYIRQDAQTGLRERGAVSTTFSTEDSVSDLKRNMLPEEPQVRKNRGFPRFYSTVTTSKIKSNHSNGPRAPKQPDREHKDRANEPENTVDRNTPTPERPRHQ